MDNENTEVEVTNEEVTTSTIDLANTEVPVEVPPEYAHIPEKFIVEGEPDYTKLAESYKSLEGKLGTRLADAATTVEEYDYVPDGIEVTDTEQYNSFKDIALEQGLSPEQFESMVNQYVAMNPTESGETTAPTVEDYKYDFTIDTNDEAVDLFKDEAQAMGLSSDQYSKVMAAYENEVSQLTSSPEQTKATLEDAWGNDYESNLNQAFEAVKTLGIDVADVKGNNMAIQILAKFGAEMKEDNSPNSATNNVSGLTEMEVNELMLRDDYFSNKAIQKQVSAYFNN